MSLPLPDGCEPRCPACPHRTLSMAESLGQKLAWAKKELGPSSEKVMAPLSPFPEQRWGYRRKALLHGRLLGSRWAFGVVKRRGREEEFIPIPACPLHHTAVNRLFEQAARHLSPSMPVAFGLVSGSAFTLVLKEKRSPERIQELSRWDWPKECSLWVNWNPAAGKRALDSRFQELVKGEAALIDDGIFHGPTAFRQQIPSMEAAALGLAESFFAELGQSLPVVDLYCGLGASLQRWERRGWECIGVELSGESLQLAAKNAPLARLLRGRAEDRLPQLTGFLEGRPFVAYSNPPRSGHHPKVLQWLLEQGPKRLAYLSCHPRSLAGDLQRLEECYGMRQVQPFDFFPQTSHLESLALLERKSGR